MNLENLKDIINNKTKSRLGREIIKEIFYSPNNKVVVKFFNRVENYSSLLEAKQHLFIAYSIKDIAIPIKVVEEVVQAPKPDKNLLFTKIKEKIEFLNTHKASDSMKEFLFEEFLFENKNLIAMEKPQHLVEKFRRFSETTEISTDMLKKFIILLEDFLN